MGRLIIVAFTSASLVFVAFAAVVLRDGVGARAEPTRIEAKVARAVRHWAIPSAARGRPSPVPATAEAIADGRAHFADHCALCHDNDGSGSGRIGRGLYPRAPDMRLAATQALSDGELFWIIENGVRLTGMPAWGTPGSAEDSWKLVLFIRHLPNLSPQEKLDMEELNPRGPTEWREHEEEQRFLRGDDGPSPHDDVERAAPHTRHDARP